MNNQNNPKIISVYGKKPRASKTSKRASIHGLNLFYQCSKASTLGMIYIWHDMPPYQLIHIIVDSSRDNHITANDWARDNLAGIRKELADSTKVFMDKEMTDKIYNPKKAKAKVDESQKRFTATCTICGTHYNSNEEIVDMCCSILVVNDHRNLRSYKLERDIEEDK